jgi:hypothetical protein
MSRRALTAVVMAAAITLAVALPFAGLAPRTVASSCSGWTSQTNPPPTIRVFRHASGKVVAVGFKAYNKNVLSREWIASWTTASLRSGALIVKTYAWYYVLHWRGGTNADGECFDVRDDTADQVYDPSRPVYSTAAAAVEGTWGRRVLKDGNSFPTFYNAGAVNESCGANANGWKAYQWGTQACGLAGKTAKQIVRTYYYPGVTVVDVPAPSPSPTPTPMPTASPRPSASPRSTASPTRTPAATASPTPTPVSTPIPALATPPPNQALPGGGQSGLTHAATPPPAPPPDPKPAVVDAPRTAISTPHAAFRVTGLTWNWEHRAPTGDERSASPSPWTAIMRMASFRAQWDAGVRDLESALLDDLGAPDVVAFLLPDGRAS